MKKTFPYIFYAVASGVVVYCLAAFILMELDPNKMSEGVRLGIVFCWLIALYIICLFDSFNK